MNIQQIVHVLQLFLHIGPQLHRKRYERFRIRREKSQPIDQFHNNNNSCNNIVVNDARHGRGAENV